MAGDQEYEFFKNRSETKTYISKLFHWNERDEQGKRNVAMVMDGCDEVKIGEIKGAMCLRLTGNKRRTQVSAIISQDDKSVVRLTLQTFKDNGADWITSQDKEEFTFRTGEFERLLSFLDAMQFVDLSNTDKFQIEDISTKSGPKVIVDAPDRHLLKAFKELTVDERSKLLEDLQGSLSSEDINILLGRRHGLEEFERQVKAENWNEKQWQDFFEREQWVFGYGLDYRIMRLFDRELTVGPGGTDNKDKPTIDFLQTFKDYTVLVEIKKPSSPIFSQNRGNSARAGTWVFSTEFISAVSQIIEQKAKWAALAQQAENQYNKSGTQKLSAKTRNAKAILVYGSTSEFSQTDNLKEVEIKRDTFELFRRESRTIDIITYDELLERAQFIAQK